ncbi:MAG: DNA methyltransferase [Phycisphaerae bacterium]
MQVAEYLKRFQFQEKRDLFDLEGAQTIVDDVEVGGLRVPRYTNEFWTSRQRKAHSLHEISYRACFKPQLPRFFISLLTDEGDWVYDPFMGRGTTLLEGTLLGRNVAGNDVSPVARILIEPRLNPPEPAEISRRLDRIPCRGTGKADIDLAMFYSPKTESKIVALREYLRRRQAEGTEDQIDKWIRMVATNRLTGHSSGFFSVYTLPPNQAVSPEAQRKINAQRSQKPPDRDVFGLIAKKSRSLMRKLTKAQRVRLARAAEAAKYFCQKAEEPIPLEPGSVNLVVTSPPFLDTVQYAQDNWLRCWFNAIEPETVARRITMARSVSEWAEVMKACLLELRRVLKPLGWIAFEVGEVRGGKIFLDEVVAPLGAEVGLRCHGIVVNEQQFTKTANCWGVRNNMAGTNTNRIVFFRKEAQFLE